MQISPIIKSLKNTFTKPKSSPELIQENSLVFGFKGIPSKDPNENSTTSDFLIGIKGKQAIKYTCHLCNLIWIIIDGPMLGQMYCPGCGVKDDIIEKSPEKESTV